MRVASWLAPLAWALAAGAHAAPPDGRDVYNRHCYFCHGYSGDARTVAASMLRPPPRDFTAQGLDRQRMLDALRHGRPGTAMQPFTAVLDDRALEAVVDFVREAFMARGDANLRYHSPVNGWTGDPLSSPAAPFVTGEARVQPGGDALTPALRAGQRLYLASCVSCHARAGEGPLEWRNLAVSWPEGNYLDHDEAPGDPVIAVFERHEAAPTLTDGASDRVRAGERLFQANCAHCHAEDGSGRNWIGSFLDPPPPDFTRAPAGAPPVDAPGLEALIADGTPGTSMPAWRHVLEPGQIGALAAYLRAVFPRYAAR
jgi:cytochrome c oxidase cbb3-type subunit 3